MWNFLLGKRNEAQLLYSTIIIHINHIFEQIKSLLKSKYRLCKGYYQNALCVCILIYLGIVRYMTFTIQFLYLSENQ